MTRCINMENTVFDSDKFKGQKIPTYDSKSDIWVVDTAHGVEFGDMNYVLSEFVEGGLHYSFNTLIAGEVQRDHEHSFAGVILALLDDVTHFSIIGFEEDYSQQEIKFLNDIQNKIYTNILNLAIEVAKKSHAGQYDKGGHPYFLHVQRVANSLTDKNAKVVAYLHDTVEDTDITIEKLKELGFSDTIVSAVQVLTHERYHPYFDYIAEIKKNKLATMVKLADLKDNMNLSRITTPTEKDFERVKKYQKAVKILEGE